MSKLFHLSWNVTQSLKIEGLIPFNCLGNVFLRNQLHSPQGFLLTFSRLTTARSIPLNAHSYSNLLIIKPLLCGEKNLVTCFKKLNSVTFPFMKIIVRHHNFKQWTIGKLWYLFIRLNLLISVPLLSLLQHPRTPNALDRQLHSDEWGKF